VRFPVVGPHDVGPDRYVSPVRVHGGRLVFCVDGASYEVLGCIVGLSRHRVGRIIASG